MGSQTVVRHTPDCIVLINGHTEFAVCSTCNNKLDFNKYITQVSCDPTVEPVSNASISMSIPTNDASVFSHDGNYILKPGLEVVILMRGYYPVSGYAAKGSDEFGGSSSAPATASDGTAGEEIVATPADPNEDVPVYPYYQTFRGVVTEVGHEYSGGFYTATLSCSNILHFWQYLQINTNGSVFGTHPDQDGGGVDLTGHKMNGMSPYAIIYTLMRVGFGSAFGVNWTIAQKSNISAVADGSGQSLYKHAALWWEKRWQEASTRLRMYGADGSLFNAFEQAYVGVFDVKGNAAKGANFIRSFGISLPDTFDPNATTAFQEAGRTVGYVASDQQAAVADESGQSISVIKMQAFVLDLGRMGQPNMFDAEYMSKLEIANTVKDITGFEFYQDVDGDIVFKPPYYNMDTSEDPVYRIEDRDLISISESESEPESTYVKGSGGLFQNFTGILDGEFGTRQGKFVDWRLVAQFGWKEANFESQYMSSSGQLFVSAMMRLDLNNVSMRSASITIPLRPELRPGYPVYVVSEDCFFYISSMSHSFAVGGACQTTINGVAKRSKFLPPGLPDRSEGDGSQPLPSLDDVRLASPGEYPPMPLYVYEEDLEGSDSAESSGPPRIIGFPNCVMALDPTKLNPLTFAAGIPLGSPDAFLDYALTLGILRRDPTNRNQYYLSRSNEAEQDEVITYNEVSQEFQEGGVFDLISKAVSSDTLTEDKLETLNEVAGVSETFGAALITAMQRSLSDIEDQELLKNWISLQTATKNLYGHQSLQGQYRYFSSSAPDVEDQAPSELTINGDSGEMEMNAPGGPESEYDISVLRQTGGRITLQSGKPTRAFRVYGTAGADGGEEDQRYVDVTTDDIRFVNFQRIVTKRRIGLESPSTQPYTAWMLPIGPIQEVMKSSLMGYARQQATDDICNDRFGASSEGAAEKSGGYTNLLDLVLAWADTAQVASNPAFADAAGPLDLFYNALARRQRNRLSANNDLVANQVWRQSDAKAVNNISAQAARTLANLLKIGQRVAKNAEKEAREANGGEPDAALLNRYNEAKATLLAGFAQEVVDPSTSTPTIVTDELVESSDHSLVLPVSDNKGYEVYGSLAYGRGLNTTSYKNLLAVEGSPTGTGAMEAIEQYLASLIAAGGGKDVEVSRVLLQLSPEQKADLAAGFQVTPDELEGAVEELIYEADSEQVFIRNTPVSSRSRGQSYTSDMATSELAAITAEDGGICLCNGVEANYYLQAFNGDWVRLHGEDAVAEWQKAEAVEIGTDWKLGKETLAGEHLDTRASNRLIEGAKDFAASYSNLVRNTGGQLRDVIEEGREDVREALPTLEEIQRDMDEAIDEVRENLGISNRTNNTGTAGTGGGGGGGRGQSNTPVVGAPSGSPFNEPYTQGPGREEEEPGLPEDGAGPPEDEGGL